jgi:hypothetical protein
MKERARSIFIAALAVVLAGLAAWGGARTGSWSRADPSADRLVREFEYASRLIRLHQHPAGYWLTQHTTETVFEHPNPEVNVFVPAIIVELLTPIAEETGLGDVLDRARSFLRGQIEETGLVRYHGRMDQPYLPQYGCQISPDLDDTTTVWTIAPPSVPQPRARSAIQTMRKYRSEEGLYRTWLADQADYSCVDPGRDPNPPDIVANMRVYRFFAQYDPEAALPLCNAVRQTMGTIRFWVYYEMAPLVPLLLATEASREGCPLQVPDRPLRRIPPNQDSYLTLGRLYRALLLGGDPTLSAATVVRTLAELGEGDLRRIATTPPLVFHNDFTGKTSRFYWSVDMGAAAWLRLYVEAARRWPGTLALPVRKP